MSVDDVEEPRRDVLGSYIRAQRQLADLSLRQLASMSNVSNAYLSQVERGLHQPSLKILRSIAKALNLPSEALLNEAGLVADTPGQSSDMEVEKAVDADPHLSEDEKRVLIGLYRSLRQRHG